MANDVQLIAIDIAARTVTRAFRAPREVEPEICLELPSAGDSDVDVDVDVESS